MTPEDIEEYAEYCIQDTRLCKQMGEHFDKFTPPLEARLIDMTIRMFTEPALVGDIDMMQHLYETEVARKEGLLALANLDRSELMSANKFAERLKALGVTPPTKISPRTGKETFAFARTDKAFTALQEHDNPEVQALVAARIGAKTTIAETRALRFLEMAKRGPLPVYLSFWGPRRRGVTLVATRSTGRTYRLVVSLLVCAAHCAHRKVTPFLCVTRQILNCEPSWHWRVNTTLSRNSKRASTCTATSLLSCLAER